MDPIYFKIFLFLLLLLIFTHLYYVFGEYEDMTLDEAFYIAVSCQTFTSSNLRDKSKTLQRIAVLQMILSYILVLYSVLE